MSYYFGTDTNNGTPFPDCGSTSHFYIGRLGGETTPGGGGFDDTAASDAGALHAFAYWDLAGPTSAPSGSTYTEWGKSQAESFYTAWENQSAAKGTTLFADIEPLNGGWLDGGVQPIKPLTKMCYMGF